MFKSIIHEETTRVARDVIVMGGRFACIGYVMQGAETGNYMIVCNDPDGVIGASQRILVSDEMKELMHPTHECFQGGMEKVGESISKEAEAIRNAKTLAMDASQK